MYRLVLLRHGQTDWNAEDRYQGRSDIELNETGLHQAQQAQETWAATDFDLVLASPLKRAHRTAEIVLSSSSETPILDDRLMETRGGAWESLTFTEIIDTWPDQFAAWRSPHLDAGPLDGETPRQSGTRFSECVTEQVAELRKRGVEAATILVVAHGNTIRAATHLLQGNADEAYGEIPRLENCRAHVLTSNTGLMGEWDGEQFNV